MQPQTPEPETSAKNVLAIGNQYKLTIVSLCLQVPHGNYRVVPYQTQFSGLRVVGGEDPLLAMIKECLNCTAMIVDYQELRAIEIAKRAGFSGPIIGITFTPADMPGADMVLSIQALADDGDLLERTLDQLCNRPYSP